ncbi:MAG: hypothetical protein ACKN82_00535, partial [Pirellula sp.]
MSPPLRLLLVLACWHACFGFAITASRSCSGYAQQEDLNDAASTGGPGLSLESATLSARSLLQGDPLIVIRCIVRNGSKEALTGIVSARVAGNLTDDDRYK